MLSGTNTIFFAPFHKVPKDRKVSYVKHVATIRPNKVEVNRVRLTAVRDRLDYPGITATNTTSLTTAECHLSSVISTEGARYMTPDIQNIYYSTPLLRFEYLRVLLTTIPNEIVQQYGLDGMAHNGWVYMKVWKGMPGLKQTGKVVNDSLTKHLAKYGYSPVNRTPVLWKHQSHDTTFTL